MFADWFKEGQHPEELNKIQGIPMSLINDYRKYYKDRINEERMEIRKPTQ